MMSFFNYLVTILKKNSSFCGLPIKKHKMVYHEWRDQIESKKSPIELELPWITIIAKNYLVNYFKNKLKSELKIFEFGSGGSSLFFLKYADYVVSVEHNREWFEKVNKKIEQEKIYRWNGNLIEPQLINLQNSIELNTSDPHHYYSTDVSFINYTFKNYTSFIDKFPDNYFDVVLVDGRSRPSCLLHSLNKVKKGGLLILDNAERKYYLSKIVIAPKDFDLVISAIGPIISYNDFSQTNIYIKN